MSEKEQPERPARPNPDSATTTLTVSPLRTSVPSANPGRRMGDCWWQVSWLASQGENLRPSRKIQWH